MRYHYVGSRKKTPSTSHELRCVHGSVASPLSLSFVPNLGAADRNYQSGRGLIDQRNRGLYAKLSISDFLYREASGIGLPCHLHPESTTTLTREQIDRGYAENLVRNVASKHHLASPHFPNIEGRELHLSCSLPRH